MAQGVISKSVIILLLMSHIAHAETLVQKWKITLAGVSAARATLTYTTSPQTYTLHMSAKMAGPLSMVFSWKHESESNGLLRNDTLVPQHHEVSNAWEGEKSIFTLEHDISGRITGRTDTPPPVSPPPPPDSALTDNALDFLSDLVAGGLFVASHDACPAAMPTFDGKRRYDVTITDAGLDDAGGQQARHCRMDIFPFTPAGGKRPKGWFWKRNGKGKHPDPVDIWMAKRPGSPLAIPVKCRFTSDLGTVEMLLESP